MIGAQQELAKFMPIRTWSPKIGDFIICHGWIWNRWYGVITGVNNNVASIVTEGLPFLLFTLTPEELDSKKKMISISKIRASAGGAYAVLQDGVWYIDG